MIAVLEESLYPWRLYLRLYLYEILFVTVRKYSPQFTIRPPPVSHIMAGGALNLSCVAVGSPMPYVRWSCNGERLGDHSNSPIGRNVLQLNNIQESANCTCRAASDLGTIELITEVRVEGKTTPHHIPISVTYAVSY